jgi:hypothetical protein
MDLTKFGFTTSKKKKTDDHDDEKNQESDYTGPVTVFFRYLLSVYSYPSTG